MSMSRYEYFVKKVKDYHVNNKIYLSHSEVIMVAFALNIWWRENLLSNVVKNNPYDAWHRLDDVQKKVVDDFREEKFGIFVV
jgi:hypothetical protein